jgi:uncharacterized protein involved in exopolysaccharide biosynthesis
MHDLQDDGVSLVGLWLVMVRRKGVVLAALLLGVAATAALSFVPQPVYESRAVLEIGRVGGSLLVEDPTVLVRRLREEYGIDHPKRRNALPRLDSVEHQAKSGQYIVVLKARDHSAEGAHNFLESVVSGVIERHRNLYGEVRNSQDARLRDLDSEIGAMQTQVSLLANLTKELNDRGQAAVVAVERGKLLETLATLRGQRMGLLLSLSTIQSHPTRLIGEPNRSEDPVKPKPVLYLALGVTLGLLLGVFAAFFAEFLSRARKEVIVRQGDN